MNVGIMLVDDHELLRTGLRARLGKELGLVVLADVGTAQEAYDVIEQKTPQVVVMDLDLPGENGLVATSKIKARWPDIRVVALTGSTPSKVAKAVLQAGADALVTKYEGSDELVRAIRVVLTQKAYLSPEAATAIAANIKASPDSPDRESSMLTDRESAVLKALAEGQSYKEIATHLGVGVKSVETYRARMVRKLGCSTRAELVRCAVKLGLIQH